MKVQLATLGTSAEVIINTYRHKPFDEIHIFCETPENNSHVDQVKKMFHNSPIFSGKIREHEVLVFDLMDTLLTIIDVYKEIERNYLVQYPDLEISLNMTAGTKPMVSAMMLAGYMIGGGLFYIKKDRHDDEDMGELIEIPTPKILASDIKGKTKRRIVKTLARLNNPINLTQLTKLLNLESPAVLTEHIRFFENNRVILSTRDGRQKLVELTNEGKILEKLLD